MEQPTRDIIDIQELVFQYIHDHETLETPALSDVTLTVRRGSFVAVIGSNGSGKSTLAKNLNALLLPTSGRVLVDGRDTRDEANLWEIRQTAGMVFQNPDNQIVATIVEDDVAFGPENLGMDPTLIRQRVDESLASVNMGEYRKKAPHMLSGGQKQRIAIAGVVAMKPKCIIFDEPTAMLDPKGRREVMDIIRELHREGITVILITHFMEEAAQADRIVILDAGRIALEGTPREIFRKREELRSLRLDVPFTVELCHRMRERGLPVPQDIVGQEELIEYLCQLK